MVKINGRIEETKRVKQGDMGLKISVVRIHRKTFSFSQIERRRLRSNLQSNQDSLGGFRCNKYRGKQGPKVQVISISRAADGGRRNIVDEEREKNRLKS